MFKIIERRYFFFLLSAIIILPGVIAIIAFGIPRSIDFEGGSQFELAFENGESVSDASIAQVFLDQGFEAEPQIIQATADGELRHQIRAKDLASMAEFIGIDPNDLKDNLYAGLRSEVGEFEELSFNDVGPTVGAEVTKNATFAVIFACIGILGYLTVMFRNVPNPVRYGLVAISALIHDVLIVLGVAAFMGYFFKWEVDALFLTAVLTVIGFSVHDSIVVFDRIRENVGRMRGVPFESVVNHSVIQTLDRSINTQLTAVFTLVAIWLYSQGQLKTFVFWLTVGFISGTYSSICHAAPLLVVWSNREWNKWFGKGESAAA